VINTGRKRKRLTGNKTGVKWGTRCQDLEREKGGQKQAEKGSLRLQKGNNLRGPGEEGESVKGRKKKQDVR